jgi:Cu-Zn family superoxide dismutase
MGAVLQARLESRGFGLGLILWLAVCVVMACAIRNRGVAPAPSATAELRDAVGQVVGAATFVETRDGITIVVTVRHLVEGVKGVHIHAVGKCVGPGFQSAGGHFNPHGRQHGLRNPAGPHAGDLPNLVVNESGAGRLAFTTSLLTLMGRADSVLGHDGTSLVLAADSDDEITEPSGLRAGRVACGVIVPAPDRPTSTSPARP